MRKPATFSARADGWLFWLSRRPGRWLMLNFAALQAAGMMPGLGVIMAAGHQVRMLASVADRDRAIRILQESFAEGRLAMDEFDQRVGLAIVSRDFRELLALTADLPAGPFDRLPAHRMAPRPSPGRQSRGLVARLAQGWL
jgi:hypothetical protein